jgi:con80 domain of Katanin
LNVLQRKFSSLSMGGLSPSFSLDAHDNSLSLEQTELETVTNIVQGHQPMMTVLSNRHRNLQVVYNLWQNKDAKVGMS